MYVSRESLEEPQVAGFMDFLLNNPALVSDVGYVELPEDEYETELSKLAGS
jgi:hypothetical protein